MHKYTKLAGMSLIFGTCLTVVAIGVIGVIALYWGFIEGLGLSTPVEFLLLLSAPFVLVFAIAYSLVAVENVDVN